MRSSRRATVLGLGLVLPMSACGQGSDAGKSLDPRLERMVPTQVPAVAVTPRSGQPAETRLVEGKFFSIYVPANFREKTSVQANGEQTLGFDAPSSSSATPIAVGIVPNPKPKMTAIESSYGLEVMEQAKGVKDLTRSTVQWPGTQNAILLQWTAAPSGALATDKPQRNWQLIAQVNDQLIVDIVAFAPAEEFDKAGLARIVETFRPHA